MIYAAAAVSDFYVHFKDIREHKIQSQEGDIHLRLHSVPKVIYMVKHIWCPSAFLVTFKLETDPELLETKALTHLGDRYHSQAVVANRLEERARRVSLFLNMPSIDSQPRVVKRIFQVPSENSDGLNEQNLETELIACLCEFHNKFISNAQSLS
ncbi:uncharacterized protein LOC126326195 [Schistocerca gregaria]|uniref:uncharacterized protein LOC126326195 n=1 Tax=Schistocerca gregaria TaxID=7010 RepID=UPI00211F11A7|nr:uncharacterized protein LOC126326195 [Schistocerca gregaria]